MKKYSDQQIEQKVQEVITDSFCILKNHISPEAIRRWREAFAPLLDRQIQLEGTSTSRGSNRYYVTLPFAAPFADPNIFENRDILAIVERLVGKDHVMCQLASDTPLLGSDYQEIHRDTPPLFPNWDRETPPYQLAVNFPLVDVTEENGPFEVIRGTHMMTKEKGLGLLACGELKIEKVMMKAGDVMIRDVRALHRGTPNRTETPRPMVVLGYNPKWYARPEVSIQIPRAALSSLSERAKSMLRYNPIVEEIAQSPQVESYQSFSY